MNSRNRRVFDSIFTEPTLASVKFSDVERLLVSIGVRVIEGNGSRVAFEFGDLKLFAHRPHPGKEARKYQIEAVREFLEKAGLGNE
ncbi:MAG: type II toxin-antitoxin system HicA family toxin [Pyrinomonadaceae bacterium]